MKLIGSALFFSVAGLAHPTGLWWGTDFCYPSPDNTDNQCSESQRTGFDWSQLGNGDNWSFEGFNFDSFTPKRGCRASGGQCIEGRLSREDDWTIQIDAEQAPFSVKSFHIATSRKADLIVTYSLADGSPCRQYVSVTSNGADIVNHQCGGAVSVAFQLAVLDQFGDVNLELYQMGFDCSSGPKHPGFPVATPSEFVSLQHSTPTVSTSYVQSLRSSIRVTPTSEPPAIVTSTYWTTYELTVTNCPSQVTDCPAHSTVVLSTTELTTTVCPSVTNVPHTLLPPPSTMDPPSLTTSNSSSPPTAPPCPDLVPKCINTWLSIPKCDSNSDAACFCPSSEFTTKFQSCVNAWSNSQQQRDSALSYFAGICAPYVPKNPEIISLAPSSTPSPSPSHVTLSQQNSVPAPTEHRDPVTSALRHSCTTITWSSQTKTVPLVGFTTVTGSSTTSVDLVVGKPVASPSAPLTTPSSHITCKSSFRTSSVAKSTSCSSRVPTLPSTTTAFSPTDTFIISNSASRAYSGSFWAFGVIFFILTLQ